jgi:outer membrane protein insertion porin family
MRKFLLIISFSLISITSIFAQNIVVDYSNPQKYVIANISVSGIRFLSKDALVMLSGLQVGQTITVPGEDITKAIDKLWKQGLFSDVKIYATKVKGDSIYLDIYLQEQSRLNKVYYYGINGSQKSDLKDKLDLKVGQKVTKNLLRNSKIVIKKYFAKKGFPYVDVKFKLEDDTLYQNTVDLYISIDKKNKVKIKKIIVDGNKAFSDRKVRRELKDTKQKNFFRFWKASKFIKEKYQKDKQRLIQKYNDAGYRDAQIVDDSVYRINKKYLNIYLKIKEGPKYYFRKIEWVGNTVYTDAILNRLLDIHKGDVYNQSYLHKRLYTADDAVSNLYYNNGYLFFQASPQEVNIENDSVDLRILINEGVKAKIDKVEISGNTRTNDYVIRRELRTFPGDLFNRDALMRSVRELANMGNFDQEKLNPTPIPNPNKGTVDIKYNVVEKPNDMFQLSGGWGIWGFTGQVGIQFNNFSMENIFKPKYWDPLPMGDNEKFGISARIGGPAYQFYNISYSNPWFGGKKPNDFSVAIYYNRMTNATYKDIKPTASFDVFGASIGLGRRLRFPDDNFILSTQLSFDKYIMNKYRRYLNVGNGMYNIISLTNTLERKSTDAPLYTRRGSDVSISVKLTPPYSLFLKNTWSPESDSLRYKWTELYKVKIKGAWYNQLTKNLVLSTRFEYGFVGYYNKNIGYSPFEAFEVGGSGMMYYTFGKDIIPLRGYKDGKLTPTNGAHLYSKYTVELRYPILLKQMATLYVLGFLEGGNAWHDLNEFNPFQLYRSAGVGARLFVPMLGLVGIDLGYGFDPLAGQTKPSGWQTHFTFGQRF